MDAPSKRNFASSHHRLGRDSDSVWAQFSRRRRNINARDHNNGRRAGVGGNGSSSRDNFGGIANGDDSDVGGEGGAQDGKTLGSGFGNKNTCQFGGFFPFCLPEPPGFTTPKQPNVPPTTSQSVQQTSQPAQPQPPNTSVAAPSTTAQSLTSTGDADLSNSLSAATTGAQGTPLDPQPTVTPTPNSSDQSSDPAGGQAGQVSGSAASGQVSTSLNQSGLPFGADPSTTLGVSPSNTAASSVDGAGATSKGADVGAIAGGVIGTISFVLLLLFVLWLIRRRQKNRTAPSAEFLAASPYPFTGSTQFQFRRIDDSNYDTQSQNNLPAPMSPHERTDTPRSFLHMREKSDPY